MMDQLMVAFLRKHKPWPKSVFCAVAFSLIKEIHSQSFCERTGHNFWAIKARCYPGLHRTSRLENLLLENTI